MSATCVTSVVLPTWRGPAATWMKRPRLLDAAKQACGLWPGLSMSFTPDRKLVFWEYTPKDKIRTVPLEDQGAQLEAGTPEPILDSNSSDALPSFSPDGR